MSASEQVNEQAAALAQFLPLTIKGVSMDDGSISFGPADVRIVLGYITNAVSFGDFINSSLKGRRDFGAPDTAVTQLQCAQQIVHAANVHTDLLDALKLAVHHIEHMAEFFSNKGLGYSFESLGEDMPGIRDAISAASQLKSLRKDTLGSTPQSEQRGSP